MGSPAPGPASSPAATSTPTPSSGPKKPFKGDPEKRKYDTDNVDIKRTDSGVRNSCIGLIYNGLAYRSTESESDIIAKAVAVEQAAFTAYKGETPDYKKKVRSLFTNLKNKSNPGLGREVLSGGISPDKFVVMTDDELKSDDQRKKEEEYEKENMKKAQVPMAEKSISDSLECGKCKVKKVSYTQAQTRSADEPMTTFCECLNCGNRWKVRFKGPYLCLYCVVESGADLLLLVLMSLPVSFCLAKSGSQRRDASHDGQERGELGQKLFFVLLCIHVLRSGPSCSLARYTLATVSAS